jgi:predicted nucleotide-binding protein
MQKEKAWSRARFPADVVKRALQAWTQQLPAGQEPNALARIIVRNYEKWDLSSDQEFFSEYQDLKFESAQLSKFAVGNTCNFMFYANSGNTRFICKALAKEHIQQVFDIFEAALSDSLLPAEPIVPLPETRIFIGHGLSPLWRDLKDHLAERHGLKVEAYETGSRAGHTVRDVLEGMLDRSSLALLVLTGDDETNDGRLRARQNVIHETGLFQGRLGFSKAIALIEDGVEGFSNMHGINQIQFSKGNIREAFGDVVAAITEIARQGPN